MGLQSEGDLADADTAALEAAGESGILRKPYVERDLAETLRAVLRPGH